MADLTAEGLDLDPPTPGLRFGPLALRGDAAVKVQYKVAEADLVQAPQDSVDRGSLLRDEQNTLASGDQRRNEVGDCLALAGSRRPFDEQVLAGENRVDHVAL